jgi:hypothetical protein
MKIREEINEMDTSEWYKSSIKWRAGASQRQIESLKP